MNSDIHRTNYRSPVITRTRFSDSSPKVHVRASSESNIHNSPFLIKKNSKQPSKFSSGTQVNSFNGEQEEMQKCYSPSLNVPKKGKLSDRFIPSNKGMSLFEKFEISKPNEELEAKTSDSSQDDNEGNLCEKYSEMLQNKFFENCFDENSSTIGSNSNLFKFRTNEKKNESSSWSTIIGHCENAERYSRKIANRPYKQLEAPGLMDDFYLNLLDWSSNNDIAVGLYKSLYLLRANKTQIVDLFEYPDNKYVSSLIWNN